MSTSIKFDKEHSIVVHEDLSEVESRLVQVSGEKNPPLARFTTGRDERPVLVNAALVRTIYEKKSGSGKAHFVG